MARFEAFGFCDARNVGLGCFCAVAGPAEDLQVLRCICATHSEGQYVVNVPSFAGVDLLNAYSTESLPHEEQI